VSNNSKYYLFNGQRIALRKNGVLTYLHSDHLGSTVLESNTDGAGAADQKYYAYGRQRDSAPVTTDYRFTGQKEDASGLYYFNARYYDPSIGQFISPDTLVPDPSNVQAYNRYMYALGNPLRYNDPSGHSACAGVCPASSSWQQVFEAIRALAASATGVALAPEIATGAVVVGAGVALPIATISFVDEALNDTGPAYPLPAYDPGRIQESFPLAGTTTVTIQGAPLVPALDTSNPGFTLVDHRGLNIVEANSGASGGERANKAFTKKGKGTVIEANKRENEGVTVCAICGAITTPALQSRKGVSPAPNETHVDHIIPRSLGGDGSPPNGQVLCRTCNLRKSNNLQ
jgi:RHS repeat-associated protein